MMLETLPSLRTPEVASGVVSIADGNAHVIGFLDAEQDYEFCILPSGFTGTAVCHYTLDGSVPTLNDPVCNSDWGPVAFTTSVDGILTVKRNQYSSTDFALWLYRV